MKRPLTREDLELWIAVTRTVTPRPGRAALANLAPPDAPTAAGDSPEVRSLGDHEKPQKGPFRPHALPLAPLERRLKQRLARGQIEIDRRIDLHGMRQEEAHAALRAFLRRAGNEGARVVLVVTGKGGAANGWEAASHDGRGVLRRNVPHWLAEPDLRNVVLGFEEAARTHGGAGALYVRLRGRVRSEGGAG
jgi:DNA-nicking Smr family endonuclease